MSVRFTRLVQQLPASVPFTGPETLERQRGHTFTARLGANESAFGISSLARDALHRAIDATGCSWYGDPENHELRTLLAEKHGVGLDNLCVDAGIDALLGLTIRVLIEPGVPVVTSQGAYPTFNYHVAGFGGVLHTVPYSNHHEDPDALLAEAQRTGARLIYLSNPDNPMGTCLSAERIQALIDSLPETTLLLLDEAYVEFMHEHSPVKLDPDSPNVIRYRTFSKAYGLAGLRIGYVMANAEIIAGFERIRNHFAVNRLAQIAATASLQDPDMLPSVERQVIQGRQRIEQLAHRLQLPFLPSSTNFVALDMGSAARATRLLNALQQQGIFLRKPQIAPLDRFLRIGIGSPEEQSLFENAFEELLDNVQAP